jgi:hypothetical protein
MGVKELICPLLSIVGNKNTGGNLAYCIKEKCAWWNITECSILTEAQKINWNSNLEETVYNV